MYNMTFEEMILYAKVLAFCFGDRTVKLTIDDKKAAYEVLKKITDKRQDLTKQQKEELKGSIDLIKESEN